MLRKLLGEKTHTRIKDGFRGRPDVDLSGYAADRGLKFLGQSGANGYFGGLPIDKSMLWNAMRGTLPGGREGLLYHHVAILDSENTNGQFYGVRGQTVGGIEASDFIPFSELFKQKINYFRLPETRVGIRIPASAASLVSWHVARRQERARGSQSTNFLKERDLGHDSFRMVRNKLTDEDLLEQVVRGPLGPLLHQPQPLGIAFEYLFGQLFVTRQDFVTDPAELDAFCRMACGLADGIAALDPAGPIPPFDAPLPEPEWLEFVASRLDERHIEISSDAWREPMTAWALERGWRVEDPWAFHRAFGALPLPGRSFGVAAGDGIRVATACEQRVRDISPFKKEWPDAGLRVGCDMVLLPTTAADTTEPEGVADGNVRYAVRDGVLLVYGARPRYQFSAESMEQLIERAKALRDRL